MQGGATAVVVYANRAAALTKLGRFEAALADADAVVSARPDWVKAHFRRGAALFGLRRLSEAVGAYDAGLALEPQNESLLLGRSLAQATLGQADAAALPDSSPLERALARLACAPVAAPLPVLLLSGFLGAGKTTLLQRLLSNSDGLRIAALVNDMADVNVDAQLVQRAGTSAGLVALTNGCICCTLRDDLLEEVSKLAAAGAFDYLVIESTGVSEPMPVAATFTAVGRAGGSLAQYAPLDSLLTVVDASRIADELASEELLAERGFATHGEDVRAIASLVASQIECSDTLVLNKCDLVDADALERVKAKLRALNPRARLLSAVRCQLSVPELLHTRRFDAAAAAAGDVAGWAEERAAAAQGRPAAGHAPEQEACGISSCSLCEARPFHPQRLWAALVERRAAATLLRSKGLFWLASRPGVAWSWSTVGAAAEFGPMAQWRADALPRHLWPQNDHAWHHTWGDRQQRLVFIGKGAAPHNVLQELRACLLTDAEMKAGEAAWEVGFEAVHLATWGTRESAAQLEEAHVHTEECAHS